MCIAFMLEHYLWLLEFKFKFEINWLIPLKKCKTFSFSLHSPFPPFGPTLLPKPSSARSPPASSQLRSPVQRSLLIAPRLSPRPRVVRWNPAQQASAAQPATPRARPPPVEPWPSQGRAWGRPPTRRPRRLTPGPQVRSPRASAL
jgi:hypothetical protein